MLNQLKGGAKISRMRCCSSCVILILVCSKYAVLHALVYVNSSKLPSLFFLLFFFTALDLKLRKREEAEEGRGKGGRDGAGKSCARATGRALGLAIIIEVKSHASLAPGVLTPSSLPCTKRSRHPRKGPRCLRKETVSELICRSPRRFAVIFVVLCLTI